MSKPLREALEAWAHTNSASCVSYDKGNAREEMLNLLWPVIAAAEAESLAMRKELGNSDYFREVPIEAALTDLREKLEKSE